jgi:hypothetical protein
MAEKTKNYQTVGTVPKSDRNLFNIVETESKYIHLAHKYIHIAHKYMTAHFLGLKEALQ